MVLPVQIEREDRLVNKTLLNHVVENWLNTINRNAVVSHPQDPVKLGGDKSQAGLVYCLGKRLLLHSQPTYLHNKTPFIKNTDKTRKYTYLQQRCQLIGSR